MFNGWESYKKGMSKLEDSHQDRYSNIIPVFIYHDKNEVAAIGSEMDRSIAKGTKVISMHSITAKPELNEDRDITQKQREFYNKNEYNKWVSHAYLLMGKAHFHKHEFDKSRETFQYILSNYPDDEPQFESRIWLARIAIESERFKEAENILAEIDKLEFLPKKLNPELEATRAALALEKEQYAQAIEHLTKALESVNSRYYRQRYNFILAQVYQKENNAAEASKYYQAVIKLNPPYEMTFNARINMALSYEQGSVSKRDIERQLEKMLRDDKNIEFQDQIYYAWGNLYRQEGDTQTAMEYYLKSSSVSVGNIEQKALTYLTIADMYYAKPDYIPAQAYYDSVVNVITPDYPNYSVIFAKSISLTNLVESIEMVTLQDSVQKLSYWSKEDLNYFIDDLIEAEREREAEEKLRREQALLESTFATQQQFELNTQGSSFYFYNPTAVNLGRQEFKRKWGARALEDNWRRKNKGTVDPNTGFGVELADEISEGGGQTGLTASKYSREFYLANIPFTDSARQVSDLKIQNALYNMGEIYSEELKDYDKAKTAFEDLLRRFPTYHDRLQVYYKLYTIGKLTRDIDLVSLYQQKIINEFPESNYALALSDPEYFKRIEKQERREDELYENVYKAFDQGYYTKVVTQIDQALAEIPDGKYKNQYDYMRTISAGIGKDTVLFIDDLRKLISRYPGTEIAERSQLIITYLNTANPEAAKEQAIKQASSIYSPSPDEEHFVVVSLPKTSDENQLMFNIISFNIDNFAEENLRVKKTEIDKDILLNITSFENQEKAAEYYAKITMHKDLYRDVNPEGSQIFYISRSNSRILDRDKMLDQYLVFFEQQR